MVFFPNCKINLGLDILRRRKDGYHDIETVMYPVAGWHDVLEVVPTGNDDGVEFSNSGLVVDCRTENNLCVKAYHLVRERYGIGGVKIHLHKIVPFGAGLGGGSADAVFTIKALSQVFSLDIGAVEMKEMAARLGSDTVFFVDNVPAISSGRGEILTPLEVGQIKGYGLVIVKPSFGVSTMAAYESVMPAVPEVPLRERIRYPVSLWRKSLKNDFERAVFMRHPLLAELLERLYVAGAVYASMSGSGSALYGLFEPAAQSEGSGDAVQDAGTECRLREMFPDCTVYYEVIGLADRPTL